MKTKKLSKTERFLRWLDRHVTKIVMMVMIVFLFHKVVQTNEQRHEFQIKMIEATEKYNEQQKAWSKCYVTQANQIQMRTRCEDRLYKQNEYLRELRKENREMRQRGCQ